MMFLQKKLFIYLMKLIAPTIRLMNTPWQDIEKLNVQYKNKILFSVWHEHTFQCIYFYRNQNAGAIVENSRNGEVLAALVEEFGSKTFVVANDPKDRQSVKGTIQFMKYLQEGHDGILAVDGPRGPYHQPKAGILYIAQKTGHAIIPIGVWYERAFTCWWRWDKYKIPLPFSRAVLVPAEQPVIVPDDLTHEQVLADTLMRLQRCLDENNTRAKSIALAAMRRQH